MSVRTWTVAWLWAMAATAVAQEPEVAAVDLVPEPAPAIEPGPSLTFRGLAAYWENDGERFKPNNPTDRHYTNGVGVSLALAGPAIQGLHDKLPFHESFGQPVSVAAGLTVGQLMFTPEDIETSAPLPDDRPYAGYLYAGAFVQRQGVTGTFAGRDVGTLDHFQLDVGVVGPSSLAEDAQIWIHEHTSDPEPRGWGNQLDDEPTLQLTIRKKWRFDLDALWERDGQPSAWGVQAIPEIGGTLGNVHRHLEAGATFRAGWNLPDDFGPGRLTNLGSVTGDNVRGWSVYGFVRTSGRIVEHNLFLEGNTWRDSLSVDAKPLVGELQLGAVLAYHWQNWAFTFGYSQTFQTEEFDGQDGTDAWAAYTWTFTCWF